MEWIKCECGVKFWGVVDKEDTCLHCMKKLLTPKEDMETLEEENKQMALMFEKLGYTQKQISAICNGITWI